MSMTMIAFLFDSARLRTESLVSKTIGWTCFTNTKRDENIICGRFICLKFFNHGQTMYHDHGWHDDIHEFIYHPCFFIYQTTKIWYSDLSHMKFNIKSNILVIFHFLIVSNHLVLPISSSKQTRKPKWDKVEIRIICLHAILWFWWMNMSYAGMTWHQECWYHAHDIL